MDPSTPAPSTPDLRQEADAGTDDAAVGRPSRRRTAVVVVLASVSLALFSVLAAIHASLYGTPVVLALPLGAALGGAPVLALPRPRTAAALACLAAWILPLVSVPPDGTAWPWPWSVPAMVAFVVTVLVLTLAHGWRIGTLALTLGNLGPLLIAPLLGRAEGAGADLIVTASVSTGVLLVGVLVASRLRVGEELSREREVSAAEHAQRLLVEERTRIARELHDVVAHSTALTQVQASTARYRIPDLSPEAAAEFDDIAASARASLQEMRRLLGVLRTEDHTPPLAPQQGIAEVPELVEGFRRAGAQVTMHLDEVTEGLPASVDLTAYRIAQEALSNAVRHAPGAPIEIGVDIGHDAVTLRVHNGIATEASAAVTAGSGNGLRGMRERVVPLGGTLHHGPDPAGGWTVLAVLPLTDPPQEPA